MVVEGPRSSHCRGRRERASGQGDASGCRSGARLVLEIKRDAGMGRQVDPDEMRIGRAVEIRLDARDRVVDEDAVGA